ncbi:hypothetical protein LUZ60_009530 [Juncus effusus]|nr:hypothetical protein LUZ60_009530 [Juncus effusus]
MSREASPETDDELFNDIYGKAYTGPSVPSTNKNAPSGNTVTAYPDPVLKSHSEEEEEENSNDPFGIPTDFTSRDKKFWDAKAKATEINFNKRKKEEMICKLCGDPNHFTQGCPSTLGMNKKTNEHFERVPARDKRIRDLFSPETISRIEKETGCKLALNDKFLIVSSKEPGVFSKGIHKVHGMIQEMREKSIEPEFTQEEVKPSPSPPKSRVSSPPPRSRVSRSPISRVSSPSKSRVLSPPRSRVSSPPRSREKSPRRRGLSPSRRERSPSRRRALSPHRRERGSSPPRRERERGSSPSRRSERSYSPRRGERSRSFGRSFENRAREDYYRVSRGSPKDYPAKHGAPSATRRPPYEGQNRNFPPQESYVKTSGWDVEMDLSPGVDLKAVRNPRSMEELETELKREEMEMMRARDQQVDQENYVYRERIREMRETYASKFSTLRTAQSKQWDELLQQSFAKQPQNVLQTVHHPYPDPAAQAVHHPYPDPAAQAVHHPYPDPAAQAVHHPYPDPAGTRNNMQYVGPTTVPHNMYPYHDAHGYGQYQA